MAWGVLASAQTPSILKSTDFDKPWSGAVHASAGYDSNVSYTSGDNQPSEQVDAALRLYLGGSYHRATPGLFEEDKIGLKYGYNVASGVTFFAGATSDYFTPRVQLNLDGELIHQKSKDFGFSLYGTFTRHSDPHRLFPDKTYSWDNLRAGFNMQGRPGGGLISIESGLSTQGTIFEDGVLSYNDRLRANAYVKLGYDVLFNTHLWLKGTADYYYYFTPYDASLALGNIDGYFTSGWFGITTPLTVNTGITISAGYTKGWYDQRVSPSGWIASGAISYSRPNSIKLKFGVNKIYGDSFLGTFQERLMFFTKLYKPFSRKFVLESYITGGMEQHYGIAGTSQSPDNHMTITVTGCSSTLCTRTDITGQAWLKLGYQWNKDLSIHLDYRFQWLFTDFRTTSYNYYTNQSSVQNPSFMKHVVLLGLSYGIY